MELEYSSYISHSLGLSDCSFLIVNIYYSQCIISYRLFLLGFQQSNKDFINKAPGKLLSVLVNYYCLSSRDQVIVALRPL